MLYHSIRSNLKVSRYLQFRSNIAKTALKKMVSVYVAFILVVNIGDPEQLIGQEMVVLGLIDLFICFFTCLNGWQINLVGLNGRYQNGQFLGKLNSFQFVDHIANNLALSI